MKVFLARPRGFEPLTLGLEMRGFVVTNSTKFMAVCGQRREQILKLKVSDVDMDNRVVVFPATITKKSKKRLINFSNCR